VVDPWQVVFQPVLWFAAVLVGYWIYWWRVSVVHIRGLLLSYAALPVLVGMTEFLTALARALMVPSGQLLPPLHCRLWLTRGCYSTTRRRHRLVIARRSIGRWPHQAVPWTL
jgi:hypothetical protein